VIETESPVVTTVIAQRLCEAYGMKMSARFTEHIMAMIDRMDVIYTTTPWNTKVLWKDEKSIRSYDTYRVPVEGEKRIIRDIASRELTNAVFDIVRERTSPSINDIVTAVAKMFGNHVATEDDRKVIVKCIDIAADDKMVKKDGKGNISLYS
jgi:hypothetical protein